ncbi:MAG: serine protease [Acidobacteriota bacterium]|nr:serine protease [Acidobacteriota bacterium]
MPQGGAAGGTQTFSECTANFVYSNGAATFVGMAAHCAGTGSSTQTDCTSPVLAPGVPVYIGEGPVSNGSSGLQVGEDTQGPEVGTMAYDSWYTMQHDGVPIDAASPACQYDDLALVRVLPGLSVDPTVPFWGGPDGLAASSPAMGSTLYSYQNSALRLGLTPLSPKVGVSLGDTPGSAGWSHIVETVTPGIPGDSGRGFLDSSGRAFGVLSTLDAGTPPGAYGVDNAAGDLARELAFCDANGGLGAVGLVPGTSPFSG